MPPGAAKLSIADFLARRCARVASLERLLVKACRSSILRRGLHASGIAIGYTRVLTGRREIRLADLDGYKLYVNVADHLGIAPYFFGEPGTLWFTEQLIRPGAFYVDAGANAGHYTFFIASRVGTSGRVISFEPNPIYASLINRSIEANGFGGIVKVEPRALWASTGETLTFYLSRDPSNSGLSSLIPQGDHASPGNTMMVETVALSDYARLNSIDRFALVKIDVERAELQALHGMAELLRDRRIDYLIVELLAHGPAQEFLVDHGYSCFLADDARRKLVGASCVAHDHFGDFLFVSPTVTHDFRQRFSSALA